MLIILELIHKQEFSNFRFLEFRCGRLQSTDWTEGLYKLSLSLKYRNCWLTLQRLTESFQYKGWNETGHHGPRPRHCLLFFQCFCIIILFIIFSMFLNYYFFNTSNFMVVEFRFTKVYKSKVKSIIWYPASIRLFDGRFWCGSTPQLI